MDAPELRSKRLLLRPFRPTDAPAIAAFATSSDYLRFLGPGHPAPDEFVAHNLSIDWATEQAWVVCEGDQVVGSIFLDVSPADRTAELACLLAPSAWGRGVGTEAARLVIDHSFATLGLDKVFARADPANVASVRGMEKVGMRLEGVLRSHRTTRTGDRVDEVLYGLLRDEWGTVS